jgi:hypothetical protein
MLNLRTTLQWALIGAVAAIAPAALADSITISLSDSSQSTVAGGTLDFYATISAPFTNAAPEFLNSDGSNIDSPLNTSAIDDNGFLLNFSEVDPGQIVSGLLFAVNVPQGTPGGIYSGSFLIYGGEDGGTFTADGLLGTANFDVQVTPEPSSLLLLCTGMFTGLLTLGGRRLRRQLIA